jgi:hypothetical protein
MANVCLIRPAGGSTDLAQRSFNSWAARTLREIAAHRHSLVADYNGFYSSVPSGLAKDVANSDIVIFFGHGDWDRLIVKHLHGSPNDWFGSSASPPVIDASALAGKVIAAIACQAADTFGPDTIQSGATGFVGLTDIVGIVLPATVNSTHFEDAFTVGAGEIIRRAGVQSAESETKRLFNDAHDYFKYDQIGATDPNSGLARVWAIWNRDQVKAL